MKQTFRQRFWKYGKWFIGLFFVMLTFRLIYGYISPENSANNNYFSDFFSSVENLRKNYASEKKFIKNDVGLQATIASGQKYEKIASIKSKSASFDNDVKTIKNETEKSGGVIQYEQNTGNKGNREIHLLIGIAPEKFDSFNVKIQTIGIVKLKEVTKIDKTNEYRQLNAKKASLEKTLNSLNDLKSRGGAIADYISLHDKILDIETQLQELGVELGNFDAENEFCTVKFSLHEGATVKSISFMHRLRVALEWTIQYYALLMLSLLGLSITLFVLLLIVDKLNVLSIRLND